MLGRRVLRACCFELPKTLSKRSLADAHPDAHPDVHPDNHPVAQLQMLLGVLLMCTNYSLEAYPRE
jgi:hypothetical protein